MISTQQKKRSLRSGSGKTKNVGASNYSNEQDVNAMNGYQDLRSQQTLPDSIHTFSLESHAESEEKKATRNVNDTIFGTDENFQTSTVPNLADFIASQCIDDYDPPHQNGPDYIIPTENTLVWNRDDAVKLRLGYSNTIEYKPKSIISLFQIQAEKFPTKLAISLKRNGKWLKWNFQNLWDEARTVGKAFIKLGLKRFQGVGILGFNAPEWHLSAIGTMFAGGLISGIYCTNSPKACQYILNHSEANIVVVDNESQLKKILEIKDTLPHLKAIVQYLGEPTEPGVLSWSEVMAIGRSVPDEILEKRIKSIAINQCCSLIYTSGTTGTPKAVMLSHDNMAMTVLLVIEHWHLAEGSRLKAVSYLPLSHVAAQLSDLMTLISLGGEMIFAQPDAMKGTLVETLREGKPKHFLGVPRVYEKMYEKVMEAQSEMGVFKRKLFSWALNTGYTYAMNRMNGNSSTPAGFVLANRVLKKVKDNLGFQETHTWFGGAAPLSNETYKFFLSLNIVILETYGMSECTGPHIMNTRDNFRIGSVGKSSLFQTKVDKPDEKGNGEVCLRGRNIFMGYMGMEEKTVETFDDEEWLHTGDIGRFDKDGYLFITGRIKELIVTAGGENIAPLPIEDLLKEEVAIISQAVLIGDQRKFLSILLTLKTDVDLDTMVPTDTLTHQAREWCRSIGSNAKTMTDILQEPDPRVMDAIQKGIDKVNMSAVSNAQRIQKWAVLPKNFSIPAKELGPTMKLKRDYIVNKYKNVIESLYRPS